MTARRLARDPRAGAAGLVLLLIAGSASPVRAGAGPDSTFTPAETAAAAKTTAASRRFGSLTLGSCRIGCRIVLRAGLASAGAGAAVCLAGLYFDLREHWR